MTGGAAAPLAGRRVVDLSRHLPGPLVTRLLGDLGARVFKVEEPKLGDPVRQAPPLVGGISSLAALLLGGHESVALDLKEDLAREVLLDLLGEADVLVESFRPGGMAKLGLAPEELRKRFPGLVICSVSGWGQDGPDAGRAGHDVNYLAMSGALASTAAMPPVQIADVVGAWSAVASILAALLRRERSGEGAWIDQALLDAAGHAAITAWAAEADGSKGVGEALSLTGGIPCYDVVRARDGRPLAVGCLEPRFWNRLLEVVDREDLRHRQYRGDRETRDRVGKLFASRTAEEWERLAREHDLPIEPIRTPSEALRHPQVAHRGLVEEREDGTLRLAYPARFDGVRPSGVRPAGDLPWTAGEEAGGPAESGPGGDPAAETAAPDPEGERGGRVAELGEDTERIVGELGLDVGLGRRDLRKGGVGRRRSVKRWALRMAGSAITKLRQKTSSADDD